MGTHRRQSILWMVVLLPAMLLVLPAPGQGGGVATAAVLVASPTPPNQPSLDAAADDAERLATDDVFTEAVVDDSANIVHLYLDHASPAVIDAIKALHPGSYTIDNSTIHSRAQLLSLESSISSDIASWRASGVDIGTLEPEADGTLLVGVRSDVSTATPQLDSAYASTALDVVKDNEITSLTSYRYSDNSPWNGGDFIYHKDSDTSWWDCTSGYPVHDTSSGTEYLLTAGHCFWDAGGVGTNVKNGYVRSDNNNVYSGSSGTLIGSVAKSDKLCSGCTVLDTALINTSSSTLDFDSSWDSAGKAVQIGGTSNHVGDDICTSGAFDGQICGGLSIGAIDVTQCPSDVDFCIDHLARAKDTSNPNLVANGKGDSGGPVYSCNGSNIEVRGMIDIGAEPVSCSSVPPGTSGRPCFHQVFFTEIGWIDSEWGIAPNS